MIKVRMKFYKTGSMRFIGHLDSMRYFQKAIRRGRLDVSYSEGYSPHQILSFASPLSVGHTSDGEYFDLQLETMGELQDLKDSLNAVMNEELQIVQVTRLPELTKTSMSLLAAADYLVSVKDGYFFPDHYQELWEAFMDLDSMEVSKKTKKQETMIDIRPSIYASSLNQEDFEQATGRPAAIDHAIVYENGRRIFLELSCGSVLNIKPELIMKAFADFAGFSYEPLAFQIHRIEMYTDLHARKGEINTNAGPKLRKLIPLSVNETDPAMAGEQE